MAYCGPRGIPLSTFLSWSQHDQDAALEWQGHENRRCRQCGYHPDEHGSHVHAHTNVCPGCEARAKTQRDQEHQVKDDGASVVLAEGSLGTCDRCLAEHAANRAHPPSPARQRPGR